jgi:hypothetical protein
MTSDEYKEFMDRQIAEIEAYTNQHNDQSLNDCVLEWIEKNACSFRRNWMNTEHDRFAED